MMQSNCTFWDDVGLSQQACEAKNLNFFLKSLAEELRNVFLGDTLKLSFEQINRQVYILVVKKLGSELDCELRKMILEVTEKLRENLLKPTSEFFLHDFVLQIEHFIHSLELLERLLTYFIRNYIVRYEKEKIFDYGVLTYLHHVIRFPNVFDKLQTCLLKSYHRFREEEQEDMQWTVKSLRILACHYDDNQLKPTELLTELFENKFMTATIEYYTKKADEQICIADAKSYLIKAEECIVKELLRFQEIGRRNAMIYLERALINAWFLGRYQYVIEDPKSGLLCRISDATIQEPELKIVLQRLRGVPGAPSCFCGGVEKLFKQLVSTLWLELDHGILFMDFFPLLFDIHKKYQMVMCATRETFDITPKLREIFIFHMNSNTRFVKYLTHYIDYLIRTYSFSQDHASGLESFELSFQIAFSFLDEDTFENCYKQLLAKRLLCPNPKIEMEEWLLKILKDHRGIVFVWKLIGMIKDVKQSHELNKSWHNEQSESLKNKELLSVTTLTSGIWPAQKIIHFEMPSFLKSQMEEFKHNYLTKWNKSGRKFTWHLSMGTAFIWARLNKGTYRLVVSTIQMAILNLFNTHEKLSIDELLYYLQIEKEELEQNLLPLHSPDFFQILQIEKPSLHSPNGKNRLKYFEVNQNFDNKSFFIEIPEASQSCIRSDSITEIENAASFEVDVEVEQHRQYAVEAAIIHVLKQCKTLEHDALVAEVQNYLSDCFHPSNSLIKKSNERLIEREFISRDPDNRHSYIYIS